MLAGAVPDAHEPTAIRRSTIAIAIEDAKQVFGAGQVHLRPITFCERRPSGLTHVNRH